VPGCSLHRDESALAEAVTRGAAVITQCVQDFIPQFIAGGVQVQALANLAECSFEGECAEQAHAYSCSYMHE